MIHVSIKLFSTVFGKMFSFNPMYLHNRFSKLFDSIRVFVYSIFELSLAIVFVQFSTHNFVKTSACIRFLYRLAFKYYAYLPLWLCLLVKSVFSYWIVLNLFTTFHKLTNLTTLIRQLNTQINRFQKSEICDFLSLP